MVEDQMFTQDPSDTFLWKHKITVPSGGLTFDITAVAEDGTTVKQSIKYFNKSGALKPLVMGINPGIYIMVFDPFAHRIAKVNFTSLGNLWSTYVENSELKGEKVLFDFNSSNQHAFTVINVNQLVAAGIATSSPTIYYGGSVPNPINLTFDGTNKRLLVLSKTSTNGIDSYIASAVGTAANTGAPDAFASPKTVDTSQEAAAASEVWKVPANTIMGTYMDFNFHRVSKTFVIADERIISGVKRTVIQGFTEGTGVKKFEAEVGADISNIAINNTDGIIYVAENRSSLIAGKLKAININTGAVSDLGESKTNVTVANYSDLRMDNVNKKLYIGDTVADAIYEVSLANKILTELDFKAATIDTGPVVEN
jgi:hypothetical protein